jgi:hypothetical protein
MTSSNKQKYLKEREGLVRSHHSRNRLRCPWSDDLVCFRNWKKICRVTVIAKYQMDDTYVFVSIVYELLFLSAD